MNKSNLYAMETATKSNIIYAPSWPDVSGLHSKSVIDVSTGTVNTDFRVAKSLNAQNTGGCEFSFAVSKENLLGSSIWIKIPMTYTIPFTAASTENTHLSLSNWCFSSLAMLRAMSRCAITIGGVTIDRSSSQLARICQHLFDTGDENLSSIYPMPDVSANLNTTGADLAPFGTALGTAYSYSRARRSGDSAVVVRTAAGVPNPGALTLNAAYTSTITNTFMFPLPIDLFSVDGKSPGLIGCGSVNVSLTFDQGKWRDTIKFRNAAAAQNITNGGMQVAFSETPTLYYNVVSPHESIRAGPMKQVQVYPMNNYVIRKQEVIAGLTSGTSTQVYVNSVNIGVIPRKLIICAPRVSPGGSTDGDVMIAGDNYAQISNVTVSFNGQNAFTSMSPEVLWQLSCKNGSNQNLSAYMAGGSCILSFEHGDIGLGGENLVVGSRVDATLSVSFTITNTGTAASSFEPYVCNVVQEHLTVDPISGLVTVVSGVSADGDGTKKILSDLGDVLKFTPKRFGAGVGSFFAGLGRGILKAAPAVFNAVKSGVDIYKTLKGGSQDEGGFIPRSNTSAGGLKPKRGGSLDEEPVKSRIL